jgi:hypothetical protein
MGYVSKERGRAPNIVWPCTAEREREDFWCCLMLILEGGEEQI